MDSIETEICVETAKSDRKGRRIRGEAEWSEILDRYDSSGLTQDAFSRREGIRYGTLVAWLGRRRKRGGQLSESKPLSGKFHELSLHTPEAGTTPPKMEVRLPDGTSVSGSSAEGLAQLIRLLRD
jgi:hypothetical protein